MDVTVSAWVAGQQQCLDMHALEENAEEVVQRHQESVGPLAGEVRREDGILFRCGNERQSEPFPPLWLTLKLQRLPLEKLLRLLWIPRLRHRRYKMSLTT